MTKSAVDPLRWQRLVSVLGLGFASGLPFLLVQDNLKAWLTQADVDLTRIGLFGLVALPYSLKFLWSPLLDRFVPPLGLGRRRSWLAIAQVLLAAAIALMGTQNPQLSLQLIAINALAIAFLSASQDIAFDAWRTDVLPDRDLGLGAALGVMGYRIGLVLAGAGGLLLADRLGWGGTYALMGGLMLLSVLVTLTAPDPAQPEKAPESLREAVVEPFLEFFQRSGVRQALLLLAFVVLYKLGDAYVASLATPFLLQLGFTAAQVGVAKGFFGVIATIVGGLCGGWLLQGWGVNRSLWIFGGIQALSNLAYLGLAVVGPQPNAMLLAVNLENFCGGLGTAAFVAFLMSLCNARFTATQYALLSSLMAFSRDLLAAPAGWVAQQLGWVGFFGLTIAIALPGLALLPWFAPWQTQMPRGSVRY